MRVLCAMSGGVDSSVAAALLLEQGHDVTGVTLRLWGGMSDSGCCAVSDTDDARRVAQQLGIDHFVFNFSDDFEEKVVTPYVTAHANAQTPNPCIECNRHLKFDRLLERAQVLEFDALATGHHVRLVEHGGERYLARGRDVAKDQSYVLYMLDQSQLSRCMFPVGERTKAEVRTLARELGLRTADKPESQDVCFITKADGRRAFLGERLEFTSGQVVDRDGNSLGEVPALQMVTVGQRRGLDMGGHGARRFALEIDIESATVVVGEASERFVSTQTFTQPCAAHEAVQGDVLVQVSAHGRPLAAHIQGDLIVWDEPQPRVAPGQSVVFYSGDRVLGGALALQF
ncbi:MAG: tRNA 2-thiouridine(34) synthase MnmA [Acidimicrobiales bacterium]